MASASCCEARLCRSSCSSEGGTISAWTNTGRLAGATVPTAASSSARPRARCEPTCVSGCMPMATTALSPSAPCASSSSSVSESSAFSGTSAPQKPTSACSLPRAATALRRRMAAVVVCGAECAGRSMTVVTPPAAAACVPLAKPSHERPVPSRTAPMCAYASTTPGEMAW